METIGDAYMVVGGLPTRCDNHAARVCNQALDMIYYCQRVINPYNGQPIMVGLQLHQFNNTTVLYRFVWGSTVVVLWLEWSGTRCLGIVYLVIQ